METLQLVIFTNSLDLSNKLELAQELRNVKSIKLLGEPTILPLPDDAPLEVPRIMLKSDGGNFSVNISPVRTDVIFQTTQTTKEGLPQAKLESIQDKIAKVASEVFLILTGKFSAKVNRLSTIAKLVIKLDISSKKYLETILLRKMKQAPFDIRLSFLFKEKLADFQINKWHHYQTLRNKKNPKDDKALGLSFDINTLPEIDYKFSKEKALKFYKQSFTLIQEEMKKHISMSRN